MNIQDGRSIPRISAPKRLRDVLGAVRAVACDSVEFEPCWGLVRADAARLNSGLRVVLTANGRTGQTPQHRDLAHVREGVRDRPLKEFFWTAGEAFRRTKSGVKRFQGREKALRALFPGEWPRIVPLLHSICFRQRPVEQVADVGKNLSGRPRRVPGPKSLESSRRSAKRFASPISQRG